MKKPKAKKLHLSVVVTPKQMRLWKLAAKGQKRSLSSWVRHVLTLATEWSDR